MMSQLNFEITSEILSLVSCQLSEKLHWANNG